MNFIGNGTVGPSTFAAAATFVGRKYLLACGGTTRRRRRRCSGRRKEIEGMETTTTALFRPGTRAAHVLNDSTVSSHSIDSKALLLPCIRNRQSIFPNQFLPNPQQLDEAVLESLLGGSSLGTVPWKVQ